MRKIHKKFLSLLRRLNCKNIEFFPQFSCQIISSFTHNDNRKSFFSFCSFSSSFLCWKWEIALKSEKKMRKFPFSLFKSALEHIACILNNFFFSAIIILLISNAWKTFFFLSSFFFIWNCLPKDFTKAQDLKIFSHFFHSFSLKKKVELVSFLRSW